MIKMLFNRNLAKHCFLCDIKAMKSLSFFPLFMVVVYQVLLFKSCISVSAGKSKQAVFAKLHCSGP